MILKTKVDWTKKKKEVEERILLLTAPQLLDQYQQQKLFCAQQRCWDINKENNELQKKEKNGPHSKAITSRRTLIPPQACLQKQHLYKYLLVNFILTKLGSHSSVIAADLRSVAFHRHTGSNLLPQGLRFPSPASTFYLRNSMTYQKKEKNGSLHQEESSVQDLFSQWHLLFKSYGNEQ